MTNRDEVADNNQPGNNDDLLVRRAIAGDAAALEKLLGIHYDMVRAVCHRIVINPDDADDATQMALIAIARSIGSFQRRSSFSTWVYRLATNAALDELRRTKRRPVPVHDTDLDSPVNDDTNRTDTRMAIEEALSRLSPEFRVVMVLRHVADLDYTEIAAIVDVPIGTVRSRLARARAQLAETMGNLEGPLERLNNHTDGHQPGEPR